MVERWKNNANQKNIQNETITEILQIKTCGNVVEIVLRAKFIALDD